MERTNGRIGSGLITECRVGTGTNLPSLSAAAYSPCGPLSQPGPWQSARSDLSAEDLRRSPVKDGRFPGDRAPQQGVMMSGGRNGEQR